MKLQLAATFCISNLIWNEDDGERRAAKTGGRGQRDVGKAHVLCLFRLNVKLSVHGLRAASCALLSAARHRSGPPEWRHRGYDAVVAHCVSEMQM